MNTVSSFNDYQTSIQDPFIIYENTLVGNVLHVRIDNLDCFESILSVQEIDDQNLFKDILDKCKLTCTRSWLDIPFDSLNKSPGLHTYKIVVINTSSYHYSIQYFSYRCIPNSLDKPYIYMRDGDECENN